MEFKSDFPVTDRLRFVQFQKSDAKGLAEILADPGITRNITANGSSREKCLESAEKRIRWHNSSWTGKGIGVWALLSNNVKAGSDLELTGWCGFCEADEPDGAPEILYAIARKFWGRGLGTEAARAAVEWFFANTQYNEVAAILNSKTNPGSAKIVTSLGMTLAGKMAFRDFLPNRDLALDVFDYELWRLASGPEDDLDLVVSQTAFRVGQLLECTGFDFATAKQRLESALRNRFGNSPQKSSDLMLSELQRGMANNFMDCYTLTRESYTAG